MIHMAFVFPAEVWSLAQLQGRGGEVSSRGSAGEAGGTGVWSLVNELSLCPFVI